MRKPVRFGVLPIALLSVALTSSAAVAENDSLRLPPVTAHASAAASTAAVASAGASTATIPDAAAAASTAAIPDAAVLNFSVRSDYPSAVFFGFYSEDREKSWIYRLSDHSAHRARVSCEKGETVCMGAWPQDKPDVHWGMGRNESYDCNDCCYTCGEDSGDSWTLSDPAK